MTRVHERITAVLPVEAAFDYIADFATNAEWDPNTTAARRLDDGPVGVGAHYELHVQMGGRTARAFPTATESRLPSERASA